MELPSTRKLGRGFAWLVFWVPHAWRPLAIAFLVVAALLARSGIAAAEPAALIGQDAPAGEAPPGSSVGPGTGTDQLVRTNQRVASTRSTPLTDSDVPVDPVASVIRARADVPQALARVQQAQIAVRDATLNGGDVARARAELSAAQQALTDASARVHTALEANEAQTQFLQRQEEQRVYGPDGPTTLQRVGSGLTLTGGILVGMGKGTVDGVGDALVGLGSAVIHPIDTAHTIAGLFTASPPSESQLVANDVAALQRERAERIATVAAPYQTGQNAGYVLGHDVVGPLATGEILGAVGAAGRVGATALRERLLAPAASALTIDTTTAAMMTRLGLTTDSRLYRWTESKWVTPEGTLPGNPNSMALVADYYNPVPNPFYKAMIDAGKTPTELEQVGLSPVTGSRLTASRLGPSLNVTAVNSTLYGGESGQVLVSMSLRDVLARGGRIYPDVGAVGIGLRPMIVTTPRPIPVIVERAIP